MKISKTMKGYLDICRISNLPSVWTNVLCAYLLATGEFSWQAYLTPALALSCFYLAGMCFNNVCDAPHDLTHRPSRPIPSGTITHRGALHFSAILFVIGFVFSSRTFHVESTYAASLLVALIIWNAFDYKQNPLSILLMASCRFLMFAVTSLTVTGTIPATVWIAGGTQFAYVLCLSIATRYESDKAGPFSFSAFPFMLAGISLLDGVMMALLVKPVWLLAGIVGAILILGGHKYVGEADTVRI